MNPSGTVPGLEGVERVRNFYAAVAKIPDFFRPCQCRVFSLRSKIAGLDTRFRAAGGTSLEVRAVSEESLGFTHILYVV